MTRDNWVRATFTVCMVLGSGCSKGERHEHPIGNAPKTVEVAGGEVEVGVKRGQLRAEAVLSAFRLTKLPIRVGDYAECVAAGVCNWAAVEGSSCEGTLEELNPKDVMTCVSPQQATDYCSFVGGRLPSLAEWLLAARGPRVQRFPWGDDAPTCEQHWSGICEDQQRACADAARAEDAAAAKQCFPAPSLLTGKHKAGASHTGLQDVLLATGGELVAGDGSGGVFGCERANTFCVLMSSADAPGSLDYITVPRGQGRGTAPVSPETFGFRCAWSSDQ